MKKTKPNKPKEFANVKAKKFVSESDPINSMLDSEVDAACCFVVGCHIEHKTDYELLGMIVTQLRLWNCDFSMNRLGMVKIIITNYPNEHQITCRGLKHGFLKAAQILGKWNLNPV